MTQTPQDGHNLPTEDSIPPQGREEAQGSNPTSTEGELREKLAAIEHERWSDWQKWCHEVLRQEMPLSARLDLERILKRWDRQIATPYDKLSDSEKASDMEQVDRYWPLIEQYASAKAKAELEALAEQYGEFRDETLGKPIDIKAVSLYRIKHRINTLGAALDGGGGGKVE